MKDNPALIDTNILVYAYDSFAGFKHEKAKELVKKAWEEGAVVSLQNLCEFFVVITENVKDFSKIKRIRAINPFK